MKIFFIIFYYLFDEGVYIFKNVLIDNFIYYTINY
jgi:hypothetical protein